MSSKIVVINKDGTVSVCYTIDLKRQLSIPVAVKSINKCTNKRHCQALFTKTL